MKIILCGACGRMGRNVAEVASARGDEIVCGIDVAPSPMPFPVYRDFSEIFETADVLIDFSSPARLSERLAFCTDRSLPAVLGATGWSEADDAAIRGAAERIPLFRTGNFSIGVAVLNRLAREAAAILGTSFDAEIVERHHKEKKDAPSGTALMLAQSVCDGIGERRDFVCGREGTDCKRTANEIGIHSLRGGTIVGEHEVLFAGEDETVSLSHSAGSRRIFASGALRAAEWLLLRPAGLYGTEDLLDDLLSPSRRK